MNSPYSSKRETENSSPSAVSASATACLPLVSASSDSGSVLSLGSTRSIGSTSRTTMWALAPPKPKPETPAMACPL
ncbi:Uncharacterised protein [Mycobacteroides abscessus subsp. abscessus]|nr:Uncharacterised protein [Mycobacteroides abscessus subsp. abscessus]SKU75284.1 Uncharacterised protein [Mycobacteroides abscessus subsp. abscessus]